MTTVRLAHAMPKKSTLRRMLYPVISSGILIVLSLSSYADDSRLDFTSETILAFFSREEYSDKSSGQDTDTRKVIPVYEYMTLSYAGEDLPYALHVHGWARLDAGDGDYYEDDPDGELLYGYLEYRTPFDSLNIKLGRQHIFYGVTNESVDGIDLSAGLGPYLDVSAFAGYPVAYEEENGRSGDGIIGGRAVIRPFTASEIGVSFKRLTDDRQILENTAGVDLSLRPYSFAMLDGTSTYNLQTEEWREHMVALTLDITPVRLKPFYQRFRYDDYFSEEESQPQPFRYLQDTGEELTIYGGDAVWLQQPRFDAGIKFKQYRYELRDETSRYTAVVLNVYGDGSTRYGVEGGLMDGESAQNRYQLGRGYWLWDNPFEVMENWFLSMDVMYIRYQEEIYHMDHSLFASVGFGRQLLADALQLKVSGDYGSDPYFDADTRFTAALIYNY